MNATKGDRKEAVCPFCSILRRSALVRGQVFARPLPWIIVANPTDQRTPGATGQAQQCRLDRPRVRGMDHGAADQFAAEDLDAFLDRLSPAPSP
jgi:hypothetical protein